MNICSYGYLFKKPNHANPPNPPVNTDNAHANASANTTLTVNTSDMENQIIPEVYMQWRRATHVKLVPHNSCIMVEIGPKKLPNYHTLFPLKLGNGGKTNKQKRDKMGTGGEDDEVLSEAGEEEEEEEEDALEQSRVTVINDDENNIINTGAVVANTINSKELEHAGI